MSAPTVSGPAIDSSAAVSGGRFELGLAFANAARSYWLSVFPRVCRELSQWRDKANAIPDPVLRRLALEAQRKRGNCEGAAGFAAFVSGPDRDHVVRALVAFQSAYNYLDMLAEQPHSDPVSSGRRLHEALLVALDPMADHGDYYAYYPNSDDGGYLKEMVEACRDALCALPSYRSVARAALRSGERIVAFQSLNLSELQGDHKALEEWSRAQTPAGSALRWWETAAAAGSSLGVHVLIAAAAASTIDHGELDALERAYFPWIGALHSLLDSLVDCKEDAATAQRNLIGYYDTPQELEDRMGLLTRQAMSSARALGDGQRHLIMLNGMAGFYLSAPEARSGSARATAQEVRETLGMLGAPTRVIFGARRLASAVSGFSV
ncbi:MAG TPA: DUF2600 family protein [Solirubrobacteraceae bacterium]